MALSSPLLQKNSSMTSINVNVCAIKSHLIALCSQKIHFNASCRGGLFISGSVYCQMENKQTLQYNLE